MRASGTHWALSDPAVSPDWLVETNGLTRTLDHVIPAALSSRAQNSGNTYYHVESGISLRDLSLRLDAGPGQKWALPTMGGSAGQTFAGPSPRAPMVATINSRQSPTLLRPYISSRLGGASCGSNATTELPIRQRWLKRFQTWNRHYSTAIFNATLVAVGRMGIIYSLVVRVVEQFSLDQIIVPFTWDQLEDQLRPPFPVFSTPPPGHIGPDRSPPSSSKWLYFPMHDETDGTTPISPCVGKVPTTRGRNRR